MTTRSISILGCGWLGKPLGKELAKAGCNVMGSTTRSENISTIEEAGIKPFVLSLHAGTSLGEASPFFRTDVLIISLPQRERSGQGALYLDQIREVTHIAKQTQVKHILLISTTSVYPNTNGVVVEEDANPNNFVVKAERVIQDSGIPNTVLRFAGLIGPGRHPGRFFAGRQNVSGGNVPVNLIHLDDCIQIIRRIIDNNVWNQVFSACADEHPTRKDFYLHAANDLGLQPPTFSDIQEDFKIVSNEKLKAFLQYQFRGLACA